MVVCWISKITRLMCSNKNCKFFSLSLLLRLMKTKTWVLGKGKSVSKFSISSTKMTRRVAWMIRLHHPLSTASNTSLQWVLWSTLQNLQLSSPTIAIKKSPRTSQQEKLYHRTPVKNQKLPKKHWCRPPLQNLITSSSKILSIRIADVEALLKAPSLLR